MKDRKDQLLAKLSEHTNLTRSDKDELHAYITQLESLLQDYRKYTITVCSATKPEDINQHRLLLQRAHTLIGHYPTERGEPNT